MPQYAAAKDLEIQAEINQSNKFFLTIPLREAERARRLEGPHLLRDAEDDERPVGGVKVGDDS
jgi:hypothetical protein